MEYVNINSLKTTLSISDDVRKELLLKFGNTPADTVLTTDNLEIIRGKELLDKARKENKKILPLRRAVHIKKTKRFPKRVLLELTSNCNSNCTMCPRTVLTREMKHMDTNVAKRTISQLAEVGISGLWLYNIGESLLHPDFFEILKYCRSFDNLGPIWLSTNGKIMDEEYRQKILENPVDILNYSVNSMSKEQFKKVAPNLVFEDIQHNLIELIKLKKTLKKEKPLIRAQIIELPYVMNEIDTFIEKFGDKADTIASNKMEVFSQNVESNVVGEKTVNKHIPKCNRLDREDYFIFSDGSVSCCDTDFNNSFNIGNVHEQTIQEIYDGEKYQGLIKQYHDGKLHERTLCSSCKDFGL